MKLNESDYRLLTYLFNHSRESITKMAKQCKLSREQVNYKLNKYLSSGLIRGFFPIIDYSKLGYNYLIALFLKFDKLSTQQEFSKNLFKNKHYLSWGKVFGKYDLFMNLVFKDEQEFNEYLSSLLGESKILDYLIIKPYFIELFPLKFFNNNEETFILVGSPIEKIKIDETDKKILKILGKDARAKLIDIASEVGISSELALHRLRKLQKQKIIIGSRCHFNMEKLGYHFSEILLDIRNFSEETKNKIKQFAKKSKHVNSLLFCSTKPNCIVQLFHKEESDLRETIQKIKELFSEEIIDLDFMLITDETEKINTLPFL